MKTITDARWARDKVQLSDIRRKVFIEEQSVPENLEWDGEDEWCYHWLAHEGDIPAGTVRMLRDGHIGRLAVLPEFRKQGLGKALMRRAVEKARQLNLREAWLHSQSHAVSFYEALGFISYGPVFQEAGIPHQSMRLRFRDHYLLGEDAGRIILADAGPTLVSMVSQCRKQLRILSECLRPDLYGSDAIRSAVSDLARRHKSTDIRILVMQPDQLVNQNHGLLDLHRRLSTSVQIRVIPEDQAGQLLDEEFLVADNIGVFVSRRKEMDSHWADFRNRPSALNYGQQFDQLWNIAKEDGRLRRLSM